MKSTTKTLRELGTHAYLNIWPPELEPQESDDRKEWTVVAEDGRLTKRYIRFVPKGMQHEPEILAPRPRP